MLLISSPIPSICITPAPPIRTEPEPYSPFKSAEPGVDDDGYRANHLSLPPSTESSPWHSSPLRPVNRPASRGLTRDQFDSLLRASRNTKAKCGSHKLPGLRKELALKNQSPRQLERRSRFLSKVNEASCVATICVPEIAMKSPGPASDHFFMSPLRTASEYSALDSAAEISDEVVIVNLPAKSRCDGYADRGQLITQKLRTSSPHPPPSNKLGSLPPSLDEISARMKPGRNASELKSRSSLPTVLTVSNQSPGSIDDQTQTYISMRSLSPSDDTFDVAFSQPVKSPRRSVSHSLTPESGRAVTPRSVGGVVAGPTVHAIRANTARDMLVILRRRNSPPPDLGRQGYTQTSTAERRCSAPAKMQRSGRGGFDHVAALPQGAF